MDQKKANGFSLFPQPPTPPAKRSRTRTTSSSGSSNKSIKNRLTGRGHGRKSSTSVLDQSTQLGLVPAPLKIKKLGEDIPPVPTSIPPLPPFTPTESTKEAFMPPKTPERSAPQLPEIPESSPISSWPRTPTRQGHVRLKTRTVAEFIELEDGSRKRASSRLSQWLDLEDGEVDRRRLSKYLGSVLDNTFEVPTFEPGSRGSVSLRRQLSTVELESLIERCECPPTAVICHCSSSPEFERFRNWSHHKSNSSISSTACLLGVPRARFQSAFFNVPGEPTLVEMPSPPGLSFDTEDVASEGGDWSSPRTPSRDDVFGMPSSRTKSYSSKYVIPSPRSANSSQSRVQSFSRPFRPDSSFRGLLSDTSEPTTPSRTQSRSTDPRSGFLTSISTVSSFDFDFDFKSRHQSLFQHQIAELESLPQPPNDKDSNHLRTESNESFTSQTSQYELSTATATVALSRSSIKPVLITNATKRIKTPSNTARSQGSTSTTASSKGSKGSSSSFSVPEYWRQYDAGVRARSRSTTVGTNVSNESAAFAAMLTMPLQCPNVTTPSDGPVPGNAFAQRSNTIATATPITKNNDLSQFHFDTKTSASEQILGRSNTTPNPNTFSNVHVNQPLQSHSPNHNHVQAHTDAAARLKAYMNNTNTSNNDTASPSPSKRHTKAKMGLGLITESPTPRRTKNYLCVDEQALDRGDSGVFGRISGVGGTLVGRREFSEPQYYRYTTDGPQDCGETARVEVRSG